MIIINPCLNLKLSATRRLCLWCFSVLLFLSKSTTSLAQNSKTIKAQGLVRVASKVDGQLIEGTGVVVAANCNYTDLYRREVDKCRWFILTSSHVSMGQATSIIINNREFTSFLNRTHDIINDIELLEINKNDFIKEINQEPIIEKSAKYLIYPILLYETITISEKVPISIFSGVFSDESSYNLTIDSHPFDFLDFRFLYQNSIDSFSAVRISTRSEISINNPIYAPIINYKHLPTPYFDTCQRQSYFEGNGDRLVLHCGFVHGMSGLPLLQRLDAISTPPIFYLRGIVTQFDRDFNLSMAASHHAISQLMQKVLSQKVNTTELLNNDWEWKYSPSIGTYRHSQNLIETLVNSSLSGNQTTADGGGTLAMSVARTLPLVKDAALENQHSTNGLIFIHADNHRENIIGYNYKNTYLSASLITWKSLKESKLLEKAQAIAAGASLMEALKLRSIKREDQAEGKTKLTTNSWIPHLCTLISSITPPDNKIKIEIRLQLQSKPSSKRSDYDTLKFDIDDKGHWISQSKIKSDSTGFMPRHIIRSKQGVNYIVDYQGLFFGDITDIAPIDLENYLINKPQFNDLITNYYSKTPSYIKLRKLTPDKNSCTEYYLCTLGK